MNETTQTEGATPQKPDGRRTDTSVHPTDLKQFQTDILRVLAEEARYGLAVKEALDDYYGEEILHSRLYMAMSNLADDGLITKHELDQRTNEYRITDAGRDTLEARVRWLAGAVADGGDR